jgi:hypothetical protein
VILPDSIRVVVAVEEADRAGRQRPRDRS